MHRTNLVKLTCLLFFICANYTYSVAQVNLGNGLIVHLPFNGNTNDASGNGYHGVPSNGPLLTTDRFGAVNRAYSFDGIDDFITIADPAGEMTTTPFSVVLWFYLESNQFKALIGKRQYDVSNGETNKQQYQLSVFRSNPAGIFSSVTNNAVGCDSYIDLPNLSYTNYSQPLCLNRWFNIIITFDGTNHRMYLDGKLVSQTKPNFPEMLKCPADLRLGNWWKEDPLNFKGKLDDFRWYNRILTADEIEVLSASEPIPTDLNFTFQQEVCNPFSLKFSATSSIYNSFKWDFGDGSPLGSGKDIAHVFPATGDYILKLIGGTGACVDTLKKTIKVVAAAKEIFLRSDTTICLGAEIILISDSSSSYCWSNGGTAREIKVKPTQKTTYSINILREGPNLIPNSSFSSGNSGFTSDYLYTNTNTGTGQIYVGNNPQTWSSTFCNTCGDHTTGTGNLLMVDAPLTKDSRVWYRNLTVVKNKSYSFSFWIFTSSAGNRPAITVNINNQKIGDYTTVAANNGKWTRVTFNWNSENATTAAISIVSTNPSASAGNDFGLDDIAFNTTTIVKDSVTIDVKEKVALVATADTAICKGSSLQLKVTGSTQVKWSPAIGLSDANITNPTATPLVKTTYIVSPADNASCLSNDTVVVSLKNKPVISVSNDTLLCSGKPGSTGMQLKANGGSVYKWFPSTGLNNVNIATPIANPTATTIYQVSVTGTNGCSDTGDVKISVSPFANVKASADAALCIGKSVNLSATGAADYAWAPATGLSATNISNPVATPVKTSTYIVSSPSAGACSGKDTVNIKINALPLVGLTPGDTLLCSGAKVQLKATGGLQYAWSPATGLSNTAIPNPFAEPIAKTTYAVEVTDANGCKSTKDITIDVKASVIVKASADAAACIGKSVNLLATGAADYSWSPAIGLSSTNIANPIAAPVKTTRYIVSSPSAGACSKNDTVLVTINTLPIVKLTPGDTLLCTGSKVQLKATGGLQYAWSPATGLSNAAIANPFADPVVKTTYAVEVTDANGCKSTEDVTIDVNATAIVKASADAATCIGKSVNLSATGATNYAWSPAAGLSSSSIANPIASPTKTTSYIVSSPSAGVCSKNDTVLVTINALPVVNLTPGDTLLCTGSKVQLHASGGVQYSWSPSVGLSASSISNPIAEPTSKTTYAVEVTDLNGCKQAKEVTIDVKTSVLIKASADASICKGSAVGLQASGGSDYKWTPAIGLSNSGIANPTANPAQTISYIVTSPSAGACSSSDTVTISVNTLPTISITPPETFICAGASIQLTATGATSYQWTPATGLSNVSSANPLAKPLTTTTYNVRGKDANGCEATASAKVIVGPAGKIYVPNAFTPNGDGLNDCFGIKSAIGAESFELAIFNRWGERVFYTKDPSVCWDGVYKGTPQLNGNYAYYLKIKSDCGVINEKGLITLIK